LALKNEEPERILYLAISSEVYKEDFAIPFIKAALKANRVKYLVFDIEKEVIVKWKK
jgi:hypothetical protein